jgi:hypothetical protein
MIPAENSIKNIVLIANSFNPSIFSHHWLVSNDLVKEEEFLPQSIFTNQLVQVVTNHMVLLVLPDQLIIRFNKTGIEKESIIKLQKIIELLPHIPYSMMGMNFVHLMDDDINGQSTSRKYFYNSSQPLFKLFDTEDAKFGVYLSRNIKDGVRLKLDIKPVDFIADGTTSSKIQFSFNYHVQLELEGANKRIIEILPQWDEFDKITNETLAELK